MMQRFSLLRQHKGSWPEVEMVLTVHVLHPMDPISQEILAGELNRAREMIDFLVLVHRLEGGVLH